MRHGWTSATLLLAAFACGDDDYAPDVDEQSAPDAGRSSSSGAASAREAGTPDAALPISGDEPVGLDALTPHAFARLARLRLGTRARHTSSAARDGGNADYGMALGVDSHGDSVLWNRRGAGSLRRIWVTGFDATQRLKMYFDGETAPRVDASLAEFFGGATSPFLPPLALDRAATSGGFLSLLPFPYASALTVTVSGGARYFNVDGHDLTGSPSSWTGAEDSSVARAFLARAGVDPKPATNTQLDASSTFELAAGHDVTLLDVAGPRSLDAIELTLPGVFPLPPHTEPPADVTEVGRTLAGSSSYVLAIDPDNHGVMLQRRLDYALAEQRVQIAIDATSVGEWVTHGSDSVARWRDVGFWLPESLTHGKSTITVQASGGAGAWNEYRVTATSHTERGRIRSDELDVGDVVSEAAHAYVAAGSMLVSSTARLPSYAELAPVLNDLRLVVTWDDDAAPSIDAPLGSLFGVGAFGPGFAAGVGAGLRADGTLYLYFPMPFALRARVILRNAGSAPIAAVRASVRHSPFAGAFDEVGNLACSFFSGPSVPGTDLPFLSAEGCGQIVAVTQSVHGARSRGFLQGDERLYVDGARTPVVQGTGTEDFYNGGFYFAQGPFGQATHGESVLAVNADGVTSGTAMYRQFLGDPLPFRAGARFSIEHGGRNDVDVTATMLALYYRQPVRRLEQTDAIVLGDRESEAAHGYFDQVESFQGESTFSFEGDHDEIAVRAVGRVHRGSQFELALDPAHVEVTLRRLFDQDTPQRADVWVDGALAGTWLTAERNGVHRWREEDFALPPALTLGKSHVRVEFRVPPDAPAWNEYELRALCRTTSR